MLRRSWLSLLGIGICFISLTVMISSNPTTAPQVAVFAVGTMMAAWGSLLWIPAPWIRSVRIYLMIVTPISFLIFVFIAARLTQIQV